jgi:hypothetical protein
MDEFANIGKIRFKDNIGRMGKISLPGASSKERRNFKTSIRKRVWMRAGGHDPDKWRTGFIKTSRCMGLRCKKVLKWDEHHYQFDHRDNNHANISEKNCGLLCLECHKDYTKLKSVRVKHPFLPMLDGHKTIKLKVGYKKQRKKKHKKTRRTRKPKSFMDFKLPKVSF